ncbi:MAG: xanthine dehydrogenase family protein molybdopterin-binding subunit, partial [Bacteroidota bacterium]
YVFADKRVHFNGQPIALVIADTYENAVYAASRIKATYQKQKSNTDLDTAIKTGKPLKGDNYKPYVRGEAGAWKKVAIKIEAEYSIPVEVNNPMEMHGITVVWEAEKKVTVYEKTQTLQDSQKNIMNIFGLKEEDVRVITKFVGGGFGSASNTWPHSIAALIGGRKIGRPLKLVLNRDQMFNTVGYRPQSKQKIGIGAGADGKLFGITHKAMATTSSYGEFPEKIVNATRSSYSCANVNTSYTVYPLDLSLPTTMRGPGFTSGVFALESAMDELAHSLHLDPVEFRLRNYTDTDPYNNNLPFSSKFLKEAYKAGAEKINWQDRNPQPRSMKQGDWLIGYGMAGAMYPATRDDSPTASVAATFFADGSLILRCAVTDMGPGTATSMTKLASDTLGLPPGNIKFELGDTDFPPGFRQGGSVTTSALGTAVYNVCANLKEKIGALIESDSIFKAIKPEGLLFEGGFIKLGSDHSKKISYTDVTKQAGIKQLKSLEVSEKNILQGYSAFSFAAHFVKLMVNARTGVVKIMNVVCAVDGGKIVNEETARSQIIGSVAGGIGMALFEGGVIDHRYGRWV